MKMKSPSPALTRLFFVTQLLFLASCKTLNKQASYPEMVDKSSPQAKELVTQPDYETCKHGERKKFDRVILKNNLWGKSKLKSGSQPELCSFKRGEFFGWKWQLPNSASGVIGYPALQVGRNPFEKGESNVADFPVKVSAIKSLVVNYDVETHVKHRKYNLSFDLWLADAEAYALPNIKTEIMVWEDYFDFTSFGKKKETIITPFGTYDVLAGHLENPKFSQDWQYIAFVRTTPRQTGEVDLAFFLDYLAKNNMIDKDHYFTSIEFGNEIGNSSGITLIKKFDWKLERN